MEAPDEQKMGEEARAFLATRRSLLLASVSADQEPEASYAPFVRLDDDAFYIYISRLARHTRNLLNTPKASALLIEDEADASQIFVRRRLSFQCDATSLERDSAAWTGILDEFERSFGEVINLMRPLADFELFRLQPKSGSYVRGFGQAFLFEGAALEQLRHNFDGRQGQ